MDDSTRVPRLAEFLAAVPEFRAARGRRHPLLPLLLLVGVATLCGARGQSGIAAWGPPDNLISPGTRARTIRPRVCRAARSIACVADKATVGERAAQRGLVVCQG